MGVVPVSFHAGRERDTLQAFADLLPHFEDPLVRATTQRYRSFDGGAIEYVGRNGLFAVLCQSFVDGEDALVSTIAIVDADTLDAMGRGENLRPDVSFSSYSGMGFPGIHAILGAIGPAVGRRIAEHAADPGLRGDFDWCVAIERRRGQRTRQAGQPAEMTPALAHTSGRQAA